jgi:hypothetical protein
MSSSPLPTRPFGRSLADFGDLLPAEQKLLVAVGRGEFATIAEKRPINRTDENCVRAGFIRFLALGGDDVAPVHEHGVRLMGAFVDGIVDLQGGMAAGITFFQCYFESMLDFTDAVIKGSLIFSGSRLPGLRADRLDVSGSLLMRDGFSCNGEIRLLCAKIGGDWNCNGGEFVNINGPSLNSDGIIVSGIVSMAKFFQATGEVRLLGAEFGGTWECDGGSFSNSEGPALNADRIFVKGLVSMANEFQSIGLVRLAGAKIGGNWQCNGGVFGNHNGVALQADGVSVLGLVAMEGGFRSSGQVRLLGAKIGGNWQCSGGVFENPSGPALSADGIDVGASVFMRAAFRSIGEVRLLGAKISGNWDCDGGIFANPSGAALNSDGIVVGGVVSMMKGFQTTGEIRFIGGKIGGNWQFNGGVLDNFGGVALSADGIEVGRDVSMGWGFESRGEIQFRGATVRGNLLFENAQISSLNLERIRVMGALLLRKIAHMIVAVNLAFAQVGLLVDDMARWPKEISLDGFIYGAFGGNAPVSGKERIAWLERQPKKDAGDVKNPDGFKPQPWIQARKVLREMGHYEAAREVGIAFETRKRRIGLIGGTAETVPRWCPAFVWSWWRGGYRRVAEGLHWGYWAMASYGYRPLKLLMIAAFVWLVCTGLYAVGSNNGVFAPTNPAIYQNPADAVCWGRSHKHPIWTRCKALSPAYTTFSSPVYSLNVLLPVGDLGQVSSWSPMTSTALGWVVQVAVWFETLFGWVASLLLIAVLSGLVKRDE